jgi:hypothetical protein
VKELKLKNKSISVTAATAPPSVIPPSSLLLLLAFPFADVSCLPAVRGSRSADKPLWMRRRQSRDWKKLKSSMAHIFHFKTGAKADRQASAVAANVTPTAAPGTQVVSSGKSEDSQGKSGSNAGNSKNSQRKSASHAAAKKESCLVFSLRCLNTSATECSKIQPESVA